MIKKTILERKYWVCVTVFSLLCWSTFVLEKQYTEVDEMLTDLQNHYVDGVLVDIYALLGYKAKIKDKSLKVASVIDTQTGYGLVLSGFSRFLKPDLESKIFSQKENILKYTQSIKDDIPVRMKNFSILWSYKMVEGILMHTNFKVGQNFE